MKNQIAASDVISIHGKDWRISVTRNMSFWHQVLCNMGGEVPSTHFGIDSALKQFGFTEHATHTTALLNPEITASYGQAILKAVDSLEKIDALKNKYKVYGEKLVQSLHTLLGDINKQNWDNFCFAYQQYTTGLFITSIFGRIGSEALTEKLKAAGIHEDKIPEAIGTITYPKEHTPLFQSQLDMMQIVARYQQKEINEEQKQKELTTWLSKHGHIPVNYCDEPWTVADAQKSFDSWMSKDCVLEYEKSIKDHNDRILKTQEVLAQINNGEITVLAIALAEGTYLNEYRKGIFSRVSLGYRPVFAMVTEKLGSSNWRDCFYLTPDEIRTVIEGGSVDLQKIKKDREYVVHYIDEKGQFAILDEETSKRVKEMVHMTSGKIKSDVVTEPVNQVRGFSASKGLVSGPARVVLSSQDFHKVERGDILVTTMTSVDFVPVMEKAGAFVTNEGGITSHASIVAREMGKPCVIGTKVATKVFKDGDMVEVDADKGIITKI